MRVKVPTARIAEPDAEFGDRPVLRKRPEIDPIVRVRRFKLAAPPWFLSTEGRGGAADDRAGCPVVS